MGITSCYHKVHCWQEYPNAPLKFRASEVHVTPATRELMVPCGKCIGCRLRQRLEWTIRAALEGTLHEDKCFVTLTYADHCCPLSLRPRDLQLWLKRLRKKLFSTKIRFMACGEYGDISNRPHYHAILYGVNLIDKNANPFSKSDAGIQQYLSQVLADTWPHGIATVAPYSDDYCMYVAGYVVKKVKTFPSHLLPPFVRTSRRPGLGAAWFDRHHGDCLVIGGDDVYRDGIPYHGKNYQIPRYFLDRFRLLSPAKYDIVKAARVSKAEEKPPVCITSIMRREEYQRYRTCKNKKQGVL